MSRYPRFDRGALQLRPLAEREHLLHLPGCLAPLDSATDVEAFPDLAVIADRLHAARGQGAARMFACGAHVLRAGVQPHLLDMMAAGEISLLAFNGAGAIHDFEFALIGATTESVPKYIAAGQFGLWRETGRLNGIARQAADEGLGLGEALGREILHGDYPHRDISVFAQAYRLGIPATVHVGIGQDIVHEHADCDGAAWGAASMTDFLIFAAEVQRLEGGVFACLGSAVMGPEVYLKALSMARHVAHRAGAEIRRFATLVADVIPIAGDPRREAPKSDPQYYYRPYKTILVRTVADGGESFYVCGDHRRTVPALRELCRRRRVSSSGSTGTGA